MSEMMVAPVSEGEGDRRKSGTCGRHRMNVVSFSSVSEPPLPPAAEGLSERTGVGIAGHCHEVACLSREV